MAEAPKKNSLVRAALEALAQGNHAEAVQCCKRALKQDRSNYDAYVVLGKSLYANKQFEQAEISYRRAADINPGDARAWQGLAELHEASRDYAKVVEACKFVIDIFQNTKAILMESWIEENARLDLSHDKMLGPCSAQHMAENKFASSQDGLDLVKNLRDILKEVPSSEKYEAMLLQLLVWQMRASSFSKGKDWHQSCLQVLQLCLSALSWHASSFATVLLLAFCEEDNVNDLFSEIGMLELAQGRISRLQVLGRRLVHAYPDQALLMPVLAYLMQQSRSCSTSLLQKKAFLENALRTNENSLLGWQVLAELWGSEGAHSSATECVRRSLQVLNGYRCLYGLSLHCAELRLQLVLGDLFVKAANYEEAYKVYQDVTKVAEGLQDFEASKLLVIAKEGQVRLFLAQGRMEEASVGLVSLLSLDKLNSWALAEQGWLAHEKHEYQQAVTLLEQAVNLEPSNAKYHYKLGLVYLSSNTEKGKALSHLLNSARLDSGQCEVFRTLGHYYKELPRGSKRAIRCYQKSISINVEDSEAGEALCDLLDSEGQEFLELTSCQEASERSPRALWAFRRLGYIQVGRKEWSEAARNLQHAVRGYPDCSDVWEALGLAYQQLGMLTAALKAYGRVLTIADGCSLYALQQSGNLLLMLGMYRKAVSMFQGAVERAPDHPAALYGLASALLGQAHECKFKGAIRWSASLLQEASTVVCCGIEKCGSTGSFWKLWGDIELSYARSLSWGSTSCNSRGERRNPSLDWQDQEISLSTFGLAVKAWKEHRLEAALRSKRAYQHALHLQPQMGNVYADLCSCLDYIGRLEQNGKKFSNCSIEAEYVACSGLALEGNNADLWTSLGLVARSNAVRQHALIQALYVDGNYALAWAELGQLYSRLGEQELAEEAFTRARSADATLGLTWAAMSNMHTASREDQLQDAFANILYAAQLSPIANFQLGLAKVAAATHQLESPQVYAAIDQAVLQAPHLPEVHNYKGLVCELQGSFNCAVKAFKMARAALEFVLGDPNSSLFQLKKNAASMNLARVLCKAGDPHAAVQEYEMLAKLGNLDDSSALRGYSTALWQCGQQKLALSIAKVAVKKSVGKSEASAATQLIAKFCYHLSGPSAALQDIHVAALELQTNSALAVTTSALSAVAGKCDMVLQKISKFGVEFNHQKAAELISLVAASMQLHGNPAGAFHLLQRALHTYPQSLAIRTKLMRLLLDRSNGLEVELAARCCGFSDMTRFNNADDMHQLVQMLSAAAVACNVCGNIKSRLSFSSCKSCSHLGIDTIQMVQRWMHFEPWNIMSNYHLVLCLVQQAREQKFPVAICKALQRLIETTMANMSAFNETATVETRDHMYLQMMMCKSEVALHIDNLESATQSAIDATRLNLPKKLLALPRLQLTRCHIVAGNSTLAEAELHRVGDLRAVDFPALLSALDLSFQLNKEKDVALALTNLESTAHGVKEFHILRALVDGKKAEIYMRKGDLSLAEAAASSAITLWPESDCLRLLHGAICVELVKCGSASINLATACRRLMKVASGNGSRLPIAGLLLAQAQAGKAGAPGWERLIRDEWAIWPAEIKPAELYFQMGILGTVSKALETTEVAQSSRIWFRRAVHMNPSCQRYWAVLLQDANSL